MVVSSHPIVQKKDDRVGHPTISRDGVEPPQHRVARDSHTSLGRMCGIPGVGVLFQIGKKVVTEVLWRGRKQGEWDAWCG